VPHPLGGISEDEVLGKVEAVVDTVARALSTEAAVAVDARGEADR
jgi:hypothetical protein